MTRSHEVPPVLAENQLVQHLSRWRTPEMADHETALTALLAQLESCLDEYQDPILDARIAHVKELLAALADLPDDAPKQPYQAVYRRPQRWRTDMD